MTNAFLPTVLLLSLGGALPAEAQTPPPTGAARTRAVYVSVVDAKGAPVSGLTAAEFAVKEDGVAREVLKAVPATAPMQIVLLVDDSQASARSVQQLREALTAFVDKLKGRAEMSLVTVGERPTSVVNYTTDVAALRKGIDRVFSRPGSGAYVSEGLMDVSLGLQKRKATRPVIVAIAFDGIEYSNQQYEQVLKPLLASGAMLNVLEVGSAPSSANDEMRNRNIAIAEGTEQTGGRRDQVLSYMAIPDRVRQLADELLAQYEVTYAHPDALIPPEKLTVTVTRPGLTARARTRVTPR
jgi:VWFA-related protein